MILMTVLLAGANTVHAQQKVWIRFADKGPEQSQWLAHPDACLTERAIARRLEAGIPPTLADVPVSATYVQTLAANGVQIQGQSRWINAVSATTSLNLRQLQAICPAIVDIQPVATFTRATTQEELSPLPTPRTASITKTTAAFQYGDALPQTEQINLRCLHLKGATGRNVLIAVIDAGFLNVDTISAFDSLWQQGRLLTYYDFVNHDTTIFDENNHGLNVLSTISANWPDNLVGTAPHAMIALARTEDVSSETHQEEDNWVMAMEWADSLGADIIHSSLGYSRFDSGQVDYTHNDLDGNTSIITRAADMAAARGILVVNSAGNEGNGNWHKITCPCDGDSVLCVGAVDAFGAYVGFSGVGPSADGQVKPDVAAWGLFTAAIGGNGQVGVSSGTSFAAPIVAGMAACLMGAHPQRSNMEVIQAIRESASQFVSPDTLIGFGIPDACKADSLLSVLDTLGMSVKTVVENRVAVFPNPAGDLLVVQVLDPGNPLTGIQVRDMEGKEVMALDSNGLVRGERTELQLKSLSSGVYVLHLRFRDGQALAHKFVRK